MSTNSNRGAKFRQSEAEFRFRFPELSACYCQLSNRKCCLPPYFAIDSVGMKVKIIYQFKAKMRRPVVFLIWLRARKELTYHTRPNFTHGSLCDGPHILLDLIRSTDMLPSTRLGGSEMLGLSVGCLPPYSPAVTLEMLMSFPPILTTQGVSSFRLFLHCPAQLLRKWDV